MWRENIEQEINKLLDQANSLLTTSEIYRIRDEYQEWYTKACRIVKQIIPERYVEFQIYYTGSKDILGMCQFFLDAVLFDVDLAINAFKIQYSILKSCIPLLDPFYQNINKQIYFEYQEDDLKIAEKLMRISIRAAGALAGFVLEKHLKIVCNNHLLSGMENKTLGQLIDTLHQNKVINTTDRKNLEYLSDTRNKCDHAKKEEPKEYEVEDLIEHTRRWIALLN